MESNRARAILQMIQDRQEAAVQPSEREELVSQGFLVSVDASTRDGWTASVARLAALRDRVREMSRVALATPGPVAPPELQQMVASLEELTRQKTNLETLVWNAPTQEYFLPTLAGRNVLADLTTWQWRLEGRTFPDFLREMYDYRAALFQTVSRASAIQGGLLWDEETRDAEETPMELSFTNVDFRFAAMILAKRAINPSLLVSAFQMFHHDTNWGSLNKVDRLIGSAILASLPWDPASVRNAFERLRVALEYRGVPPRGGADGPRDHGGPLLRRGVPPGGHLRPAVRARGDDRRESSRAARSDRCVPGLHRGRHPQQLLRPHVGDRGARVDPELRGRANGPRIPRGEPAGRASRPTGRADGPAPLSPRDFMVRLARTLRLPSDRMVHRHPSGPRAHGRCLRLGPCLEPVEHVAVRLQLADRLAGELRRGQDGDVVLLPGLEDRLHPGPPAAIAEDVIVQDQGSHVRRPQDPLQVGQGTLRVLLGIVVRHVGHRPVDVKDGRLRVDQEGKVFLQGRT